MDSDDIEFAQSRVLGQLLSDRAETFARDGAMAPGLASFFGCWTFYRAAMTARRGCR